MGTIGAIVLTVTIQSINDRLQACTDTFIRETDEAYVARLNEIADYIVKHRERCPIILLSGPSGSGKTTTARMLETLLDARGCETHTLSMDDYFFQLTDEQQDLLAQDKLDLESPERVDGELLNAQLTDIIAGRPTVIPKFNFVDHTRGNSDWELTRKPNELVILEGIHALNPSVVTLADDQTVKLYVSVRTRLQTADGTLLHPKEIRLLRRMLRDVKFRNRSAVETLKMFPSVELGEERYIMPHKIRSDFDIDTFCAYEVSVYQPMLKDAIRLLSHEPEIAALLPTLDEIAPLDETAVPPQSLIREFIGGSQYH